MFLVEVIRTGLAILFIVMAVAGLFTVKDIIFDKNLRDPEKSQMLLPVGVLMIAFCLLAIAIEGLK